MFLHFYASSAENNANVMSLERTGSIARKLKKMLSRSFIATRTFFSELPKAIITLDFAGIGNYGSCGTKAKSTLNPKNALNMSKFQRSLHQNV